MSQITDWAAKEQADLADISATLDGVETGVTALDVLIQNFQNFPPRARARGAAPVSTPGRSRL